MSRWSHCPPSSATARPRRCRVSRPSTQMRTRATTGPLATQGRRAGTHKATPSAPRPAHKITLGAPKAPKAAPQKAPKAVPQTDTHSEEVTKPWRGVIVDYVWHLLG